MMLLSTIINTNLQFDFQKQIYQIHKSLTQQCIELEENITTNGTLLTSEVINELNMYHIHNFQITLDGEKNVQDVRRPLKSGESSWNHIINGIVALGKTDANIKIRINLDENNVNSLKSIFESLPIELLHNKNIVYYISLVIGKQLANFNEAMIERANLIISAWDTIAKYNLPIEISPPKYSPCSYDSAVTGFYIDLAGNIFSCGGDVGLLEKSEGLLDKRNDRYRKRINHVLNDHCYQCRFFYQCMGGCHFETRISGHNCQHVYFQKIYDNYYSKYKQRRNKV